MADKVHNDFHACLTCEGRDTVPSRLPFRTKPCDQCGGRGVVTLIRCEQLLKRLEQKAGLR